MTFVQIIPENQVDFVQIIPENLVKFLQNIPENLVKFVQILPGDLHEFEQNLSLCRSHDGREERERGLLFGGFRFGYGGIFGECSQVREKSHLQKESNLDFKWTWLN